ncbi:MULTISPECIES: GGDEF domain-containing protein [Shewanella]|uniref:diguanylate cyclase n=1 Tax=Shewanella bicestrii TaxID=2018305 RepID=A0A220UR51_9GAMM|nr:MULTISPECIES: GGDEF domain-containing protein [Shewanella]ASK70421.1 GGDEF domain-containing protein [Shewanella bicestrii]MDH1469098.1 diguanylate cyclase [Shewanella sp. GD03713]
MQHYLRYLAICLMLLIGTHRVAIAEGQAQVDQIFALFDSGEAMTRESIEQNLSLLEKLISSDDVERIEKLNLLKCWNQPFETEEDVLHSLQHIEQTMAQIPPNASPHFLTDFTLCHAWFLQQKGDINGAMSGYTKSIQSAYEHEDIRLIADARSLRGALYSYIGDFSEALDDLVTAQGLYESLNLTGWANVNLADIATSFRRYGDPESAIKYYNKLKEFYSQKGNKEQVANVTSDIGIALDEMGEHERAIESFRFSYQYFKEHKYPLIAAINATNIAYSLIQLNRLNEAETYLKEAAQEITDKEPSAYSFMKLFMAKIRYQQGRYQEALDELAAAEIAFRVMHNDRGLIQLLQLKSDIHAAMGDLPSAYQELQQFIALTKKVDDSSSAHQTTELKVKFDTSWIESENKRLLDNQKLKEQELALLEKNKSLQLIILLLTGCILAIVSLFAYKQVHRNRHLQTIALTDYLTQLPNRRHIYAQAELYFQQAIKQKTPFSVIIFDADHFKKINDNFGHEIGDQALLTIAQASQALTADRNLIGRIGGEEFLILLPNTNAERVWELAHELQTLITRYGAINLPVELKLTVSAGVATLNTELGKQDDSFARLLKRADNALYDAKNAGRNCVKAAKMAD